MSPKALPVTGIGGGALAPRLNAMDGRSARIHQLTVDEALASLASRQDGLSSSEALRRRAEFGPNQIERLRTDPVLLKFLRQFTHFFALILWVAGAMAFLAERFAPGQGMATLGVAISEWHGAIP